MQEIFRMSMVHTYCWLHTLITPATFIVSAEVRPMSRKTDMLSANAAAALLKKMAAFRSRAVLANNVCASRIVQGIHKKAKEQGAM